MGGQAECLGEPDSSALYVKVSKASEEDLQQK